MEYYQILLPGGEILKSGAQEESAISGVKLTKSVNPDEELMSGGVCSDMLEVTVLDSGNKLTIAAGSRLVLQTENGQGVGVFYAEKPERTAAGHYRLTAYDAVSRLDQDLGQWLFELSGWPYTLQTFAEMVCERCDLGLVNKLPINASYPVGAFSGAGITGRQLMRWICQLGGCFCRATADGQLEFGWYTNTGVCIKPTGEDFYFSGGLSDGDYNTHPIEKVQLQLKSEDVGAVYPDSAGEKNTMVITGNYLLGNSGAAAMEEAARQLYERMKGISYTPCTLRTTVKCGVKPGDIIRVEDRSGVVRRVYVMSSEAQDGILTIRSTGARRRDSTTAVNTARYQSLTGKVLNLRADIEGMKIENANAKGDLAALSLSLEGIRSQVLQNKTVGDQLKTVCTTLEQTEEKLELQVQTLTGEGVGRVKTGTGYTFDESGLRIAKTGQEMENLLDNTGMYVRRSDKVILQANNQGVMATDVTVRNYLVIGDHARLEDYSDGLDFKRTACFYLA